MSIITKQVTWRKPYASRPPTLYEFSWCIPRRLFLRPRLPEWICTSAATHTEAKSVFQEANPSLPIAAAPEPIRQAPGNINPCAGTPLEESAPPCFPFGCSAFRKSSSIRSHEPLHLERRLSPTYKEAPRHPGKVTTDQDGQPIYISKIITPFQTGFPPATKAYTGGHTPRLSY